jgi:hypothetical protein
VYTQSTFSSRSCKFQSLRLSSRNGFLMSFCKPACLQLKLLATDHSSSYLKSEQQLQSRLVLGLQLHVSSPPDPVNCLTTQATPIRGGRQITNSFSHCLHAHGRQSCSSKYIHRAADRLPPVKECLRLHKAVRLTDLPSIRRTVPRCPRIRTSCFTAPEKQSDKLHGGCLAFSVLGCMRPFLHRRVSRCDSHT